MAYKDGYSGEANPNPITGMRIYWVENSYSIENNTSNVTFYLQVKGNVDVGSRSYSGSMNGISFSGTNNPSGSSAYDWHTISTITKNVSHNSDGTGSIYGSWTQAWNYTSGTYGWTGTCTVSLSSKSLTTIPRATTPSIASSITMGNATTITLNRASSSFTHDLSFTLNGTTTAIASGVGASYSWTPEIATYAKRITNATSMTGTLTCITKNGQDTIGTKTVSVTMNVPSSLVPTITSWQNVDTKSYAETYGGYIQNKSILKARPMASGVQESTIKSYLVTFDDLTKSGGSPTFETTVPGTRTISATVTDSRGRTATSTTTIDVLAYNSPQLGITIDRCNNEGNADLFGTKINIQITLTITSLNELNSRNTDVVVKYIKATSDQTQEENWTTVTLDKTSSATIINASKIISNIDADSAYLFKIDAHDSLTTLPTVKRTVNSTYSLVDYKANKKGIAFGTVADTDNSFKCNLNGNFLQNLTVSGNTILNGTLNNYTVDSTNEQRFGIIPAVHSDGVMEIGQYIDFHASNTDTSDYAVRLNCDSGGILYITKNSVSIPIPTTPNIIKDNNPSGISIYTYGPIVTVQLHGITATPESGAVLAGPLNQKYWPKYNISGSAYTASGNTRYTARIWVSSANGNVYLNSVNSTASGAWYGTLTYIAPNYT